MYRITGFIQIWNLKWKVGPSYCKGRFSMKYSEIINSAPSVPKIKMLNKATQLFKTPRGWVSFLCQQHFSRSGAIFGKVFISLEREILHVLQVSFMLQWRGLSLPLYQTPTSSGACQRDRQPCWWSRAFKSQILTGMKCFAELKMNLLTSLKSADRQPAVTIHLRLNMLSARGRFLQRCHQSVISAPICHFLALAVVI